MGYFDNVTDTVKGIVMEIIKAAVTAIDGANYFNCTWSELCEWFKKFIIDLKKSLKEKMSDIPHTACMFGKLVGNAVAEISHRLYYYNGDDKWMEESTIRQINEDEVPPRILAKIAAQETEITNEMETELQLTI